MPILFPMLPLLPRFVVLPFLALVASVPGLYVWWRGRGIRQLPDDGLLADRLEGERRRNAYVSGVTSTALIILGGWQALWAIPLSIVLLIAADFPLRRRVFGETWTLPQYLKFWLHWLAASSGFWVLLALAPYVISRSEGLAPAVAVGAGIAMVAWNLLFDRAFLGLLGAQRLHDQRLLEAFRPVVERASVQAPQVWVAGMPGSAVVTAFALPNTRRGSVLFLSPLLERLPIREIVAVFAHEVGHLEQFTPRALRLINAVTFLTIATAVLLPFVAARIAPSFAGTAVVCWPVLVVALAVLRSRLHRPLEFDSDRRAAVLCGDADAVASALIRLHALARMPRRVDAEIEQWQSHPSLARRVQALRALAGAPATSTRTPATFTTLKPAGTVTFEASGVRFGAAPETAPPGSGSDGTLTPYAQLHELRLDLRNAARPSLIYRDIQSGVKQIALREGDAAAVQAVLDEIDVLLAPAMSSSANAAQRGALVALALSLVGFFWASSLSVFAPAALASFRASAPTLAAAAAAGLSGGAVLWWAEGRPIVPEAAVLMSLGCIVAVIALRTWRNELASRQRLMAVVAIVVLGQAVAVTWLLGIVIPGIGPLRLHRALATNHALAVLPISLAALLAAYPRKSALVSRRVVSSGIPALLLALGLFPIIAATDVYRDRIVRDPLMARAPRYDPIVAGIDVRHRFRLGMNADDIRLSPGGRWISAAVYEEGSSENVRFTLLSENGARLHVDAAELSFVDDGHVLAARLDETGIDLTAHRLASGLPVMWRQRLPKFGLAQLDVSAATRAWQVWGWGEDGAAIRFNGAVGGREFEQRRWTKGHETWSEGLWFVGSGDYAVRLEGFDLERSPSVWMVLAEGLGSRLFARGYRRMALVDSSGNVRPVESELTVSCVAPPIGKPRVTCSAFDGLETHVFELGERIIPLTVVRGVLWLDEQHEDGTLIGTLQADRVLIRPADRRLVVLRSGEDEEWFGMAYSNGLVAASTFGDEGHIVVGRVVVR